MPDQVEEYRELYPTYESFARKVAGLLEELLRAEGVTVHVTEWRAKSVESFAEKIRRPGKRFDDPLKDMPDLAGARVLLYYRDDVLRVGDVIKKEFATIEEIKDHHSDHYSPDQFGYLSHHYVVRINDVRSQLGEWKAFSSLRAEIQVRTILQHAWAAVSHALQYKKEHDVPLDLRRRLFRLAGLFELADEEFFAIREARDKITEAKTTAVKQGVAGVLIDAPVISEFVQTSPCFRRAKETMREIGYAFITDEYSDTGEVVKECERVGIKTIEELEAALDYDYTGYLREAMIEGWVVGDMFALIMLLIGAHPDTYSRELLMDELEWSSRASQAVVDGLQKLGA